MKRWIITFGLLVFIAATAVAFSISAPKKETLHVFAVGKGEGRLVYRSYNPNEPFTPSCLLVRDDGSVFISDYSQRAVLLFDSNYELKGKIPVSTDHLCMSEGIVVGWNRELFPEAFVASVDAEWAVELTRVRDWGGSRIESFFFDTPYILAPDGDEGVRVWKLQKTVPTSVPTDDWLQSTKSGLSLSQYNTIVSPTVGYLTGIAGTFFRLNAKPDRNPTSADGTRDQVDYDLGYLFGIDRDGLRYFDVDGQRLLITDRDGNIVQVLKQREGLDDTTYLSFPTITRNGDIYYIESSPTEHRLIRIKRTW